MRGKRNWAGRFLWLLFVACLFMETHTAMAAALLVGTAPEVYAKVREENGGKLAFKQRFITTTRQSVVFTWMAAGRFALIYSLDSIKLARSLQKKAAELGLTQDVLVQVNLAGEVTITCDHDISALSALTKPIRNFSVSSF